MYTSTGVRFMLQELRLGPGEDEVTPFVTCSSSDTSMSSYAKSHGKPLESFGGDIFNGGRAPTPSGLRIRCWGITLDQLLSPLQVTRTMEPGKLLSHYQQLMSQQATAPEKTESDHIEASEEKVTKEWEGDDDRSKNDSKWVRILRILSRSHGDVQVDAKSLDVLPEDTMVDTEDFLPPQASVLQMQAVLKCVSIEKVLVKDLFDTEGT